MKISAYLTINIWFIFTKYCDSPLSLPQCILYKGYGESYVHKRTYVKWLCLWLTDWPGTVSHSLNFCPNSSVMVVFKRVKNFAGKSVNSIYLQIFPILSDFCKVLFLDFIVLWDLLWSIHNLSKRKHFIIWDC